MNISGPAAVAKPEMLFYAPGDLTVTFNCSASENKETNYNDKRTFCVRTRWIFAVRGAMNLDANLSP